MPDGYGQQPQFVVLLIDGKVLLAQRGFMGTADRPHMRDRTYEHFAPVAEVYAKDELNDAYCNAQRLADWLNLGIPVWREQAGSAT